MRQRVGHMAIVGTALAATMMVTGCAASTPNRGRATPVSGSPSPVPSSATASVPVAVARANVAVSTALNAVVDAQHALTNDFVWARPALGGRNLHADPTKLTLWAPERKRVADANAAALVAYRRAQSAGRQVPRDCAGVAAAKAGIVAQLREAQAGYAVLAQLAVDAGSAMRQASADRVRVTAALANLTRVQRANPLASVDPVLELSIPEAYTAADQQVLAAAVARSLHLAAVSLGYASRLYSDSGYLGRRC